MSFQKQSSIGLARVSLAVMAAVVCMVSMPISSADAASVAVTNKYLQLLVGIGGEAEDAGPDRGGSVEVSGRWTVGTLTGDPATPDDDYLPILAGFPDPWGAYSLFTFNVGVGLSTTLRYGDTENGAWLQPPLANDETDTVTDVFVFEVGEKAAVIVEREMRLVRDLVRVQYRMRGEGWSGSTVSVATSLDTEYGVELGFIKPGGPFYAPVEGSITKSNTWAGSQVPSVIYGFDNLPNYTVASQTILGKGDATRPDRVVAAHAFEPFDLFDFGFVPTPAIDITSDSALLLFWNARSVPPGSWTSPIVFYFGMAQASSTFDKELVLATSAPFSLQYEHAGGDQAGSINPDPFNVFAYAYNLTNVPLYNVQMQITLPPGLVLDEDESSIKRINYIGGLSDQVNREAEVGWKVRADGEEFGNLDYSVSIVGSPLTPKTVTRSILVPATNQRFLLLNDDPIFGRREMISIPFTATGSDINETLGLEEGMYSALRFNPATATYENVTSLVPGQGFWFDPPFFSDSITLSNVQPVTTSGNSPYMIRLARGWNQIGTPYLYPSSWGSFKVLKDLSVGEVSVSEAASRGWIRSALHWWDYIIHDYRSSSSPQTALHPWVGYWVRALEPVWLLVPEAAPIGLSTSSDTSGGGTPPDDDEGGGGPGPGDPPTPFVTGQASSSFSGAAITSGRSGSSGKSQQIVIRPTNAPAWQVRIGVSGEPGHDTQNFFGSDPMARVGFDLLDTDKAPPAGNLTLGFVNRGWGTNSGWYSADLKPVIRQGNWNAEILNRGEAGALTVNWDGLENVPKGMTLRLKDTAARKSIIMRPGQSYKFESESGETRKFQITAETRVGRGR